MSTASEAADGSDTEGPPPPPPKSSRKTKKASRGDASSASSIISTPQNSPPPSPLASKEHATFLGLGPLTSQPLTSQPLTSQPFSTADPKREPSPFPQSEQPQPSPFHATVVADPVAAAGSSAGPSSSGASSAFVTPSAFAPAVAAASSSSAPTFSLAAQGVGLDAPVAAALPHVAEYLQHIERLQSSYLRPGPGGFLGADTLQAFPPQPHLHMALGALNSARPSIPAAFDVSRGVPGGVGAPALGTAGRPHNGMPMTSAMAPGMGQPMAQAAHPGLLPSHALNAPPLGAPQMNAMPMFQGLAGTSLPVMPHGRPLGGPPGMASGMAPSMAPSMARGMTPNVGPNGEPLPDAACLSMLYASLSSHFARCAATGAGAGAETAGAPANANAQQPPAHLGAPLNFASSGWPSSPPSADCSASAPTAAAPAAAPPPSVPSAPSAPPLLQHLQLSQLSQLNALRAAPSAAPLASLTGINPYAAGVEAGLAALRDNTSTGYTGSTAPTAFGGLGLSSLHSEAALASLKRSADGLTKQAPSAVTFRSQFGASAWTKAEEPPAAKRAQVGGVVHGGTAFGLPPPPESDATNAMSDADVFQMFAGNDMSDDIDRGMRFADFDMSAIMRMEDAAEASAM